MAPSNKTKTAATWTTKAAGEVGHAAFNALHESLDAAANAAKLLRGDLSTGSRDRLREVERLVRDAQRDLRRSGKHLLSELQALADHAATDTASTEPSAPARRRSSAAKPSSASTAAPKTAGAPTGPAAKKAAPKTAAMATRAAGAKSTRSTAKASPKSSTTKTGAARSAPPAPTKRSGSATPATKHPTTAKSRRAKSS